LSDKPGDRDWRETSKWFCSEHITWAEEEGKFLPWRIIVPKNRVSPADNLLINMPVITNADEVASAVETLRGPVAA
jgi:hypothetical protein